MMTPDIILLDEPISVLDPELVVELLKVIRNLADDGMTMMIVTHEMGFAAKVSDRVLFLADGCIEEQGAPAQLFHQPKSPRLQYFLSSWSERQSGARLPERALKESARSKGLHLAYSLAHAGDSSSCHRYCYPRSHHCC